MTFKVLTGILCVCGILSPLVSSGQSYSSSSPSSSSSSASCTASDCNACGASCNNCFDEYSPVSCPQASSSSSASSGSSSSAGIVLSDECCSSVNQIDDIMVSAVDSSVSSTAGTEFKVTLRMQNVAADLETSTLVDYSYYPYPTNLNSGVVPIVTVPVTNEIRRMIVNQKFDDLAARIILAAQSSTVLGGESRLSGSSEKLVGLLERLLGSTEELGGKGSLLKNLIKLCKKAGKTAPSKEEVEKLVKLGQQEAKKMGADCQQLRRSPIKNPEMTGGQYGDKSCVNFRIDSGHLPREGRPPGELDIHLHVMFKKCEKVFDKFGKQIN